MRSTPLESESLGLRDEGWQLVLKSLDSRCTGLELVVTGDAGEPYLMYFCILVLEQVVNVALSKLRFQIKIGLAVDRLVMDYVA